MASVDACRVQVWKLICDRQGSLEGEFVRVVLRGATVIDGTRSPRRRADVAIEGQRVVAVGDIDHLDGDRDVDLSGLVLAPGFIDPHTHYDAQILWDPSLTPSCWHGVTTTIMGNCGFSIAPTRPEHRAAICRTLENVEGMAVEALEQGIRWEFESFPDYLEELARIPKRLNVASMIGHTPLRLFVMGDEAMERTATREEADTMRAAVADAIRAGAIGFATSQSPNHQGDGGRPVPSRFADRDEIVHVAGGLTDAGGGIIQVTPGPGLFLEELAELAETTGRPVTWTGVLTRAGVPWPAWADEADRGSPMELLERQPGLGTTVWPQVSCRDLVMQVMLSDPFPFAMLPAFKEILGVPRPDRAAAYRDPTWREHARPQMEKHWGHRWSKTSVEETGRHGELLGRSLAAVAAERGVEPFDLFMDLSLDENLATRFRIVIANDDADELAGLLRHTGTLIALSDAGAHASQLSDACYSTHLLGHWVRERELMSLEDAVWRMTGQVAEVFDIPDRGLVRAGHFADLVAFDPDTVAPGQLERVADLPAGADRLISRSTGIEHVWVNGTAIITDGLDVEVGASGPGMVVSGRVSG